LPANGKVEPSQINLDFDTDRYLGLAEKERMLME
jgi:hypothetical protein